MEPHNAYDQDGRRHRLEQEHLLQSEENRKNGKAPVDKAYRMGSPELIRGN